VSLDIGRGFTKVLFTVKSLNLYDRWTNASAFPSILETKEVSKQGVVVVTGEE
jgi:hypothetical protein